MPNKDVRIPSVEQKAPISAPQNAGVAKVSTLKFGASKVTVKEPTMSPGAPVPDEERTELLGSLTTQQQQRTSARVIKKLRLEPQADKSVAECETPNKVDDKDPLKFPTVKQRMPKALWSADEKSLFFEALNEYGKDFDAITAYICAKMKKKGMPDGNLKTKTQVSHFYYRTWHKLSKHVRFDENVKKVAQELYALINYGELRRKLTSVNEKTCARLGEMVRGGSMAVRARGKTLRVRTPMCRALRRLNQIAERAMGARVCSRAAVSLRARDAGAWARVQAAAHNPRLAAALPLRTALAAFLAALERRWGTTSYKKIISENGIDAKLNEETIKDFEEYQDVQDVDGGLEDHLNLETDRIIVQEHRLPKKPTLHLGPRPDAEIHLPALSPSEQLSSQKICFSSYLERMGSLRRDKDSGVKIRTPKRQRKDSLTDKDKEVEKKFKLDDSESTKLMHIDETAIDGIELMAHYKHNHEDEEKPSTEDEKEMKSEETAEEDGDHMPEKDKDMSEREKDSFSEMEDDEKYNKSESDNESDGRNDKSEKERKFKNLKVKFRIRPKKRGGSVYTMVVEKNSEETKAEEPKIEDSKVEDAKVEDAKVEDAKAEEESKPDIDVDMAIKQIRKGWSVYDAGELTIGDLYLMFGSRSKLELDYWWAEPTPPLPQPKSQKPTESMEKDKIEKILVKDKPLDKDVSLDKRQGNKTPEKVDSSVEDERDRRESDTDIFSPKNTYSQDSNDGLSGDERKCEQLSSPDHKSSGSLKLVSKLINRPVAQNSTTPGGFSVLTDRLKRLLALAGNAHAGAASARCDCGQQRKQKQQPCSSQGPVIFSQKVPESSSTIFRHPTPIAPRPDTEAQRPMSLEGLPRWRRGRPRADRRVVVQRLLPLLPKLPPPSNLIPVKMASNPNPTPPRILPRPPPTSTSDLPFYYVLSESNGQFFFHDGDRRIPITPKSDSSNEQEESKTDDEEEARDVKDIKIVKEEACSDTVEREKKQDNEGGSNVDQTDIASFLPGESMSLSPSRLLRDAEGWLEGSVQDFSLSSFLGHLEGRPPPELPVDSHLQSLMAESSVDYVAKFADLAAEVTDEPDLTDDLT